MAEYRIVIPHTGRVLGAYEDLNRARDVASFETRRLAHPVYPPTIIVQRVGPDGRARKVWPQGASA